MLDYFAQDVCFGPVREASARTRSQLGFSREAPIGGHTELNVVAITCQFGPLLIPFEYSN